MKKGILITSLIGVICLGSTQLLPVFASDDAENNVKQERKALTTPENTKVQDTNTKEQQNEITEETTKSATSTSLRGQLRENENYDNLANDLGISTEGKDTEKIEAEIRSTILQQKAKEAGISVEGKSEEALITEIKEKYSEKPELTEPSSNKYEELRMKPDSRRNQIIDTAKQNGIETEGKEFDAIVDELKTVLLQNKGK
ncbi:hypothetical protein [Bacillus sp. REN16]|uniref:hypothetical protein n=1 Tax=Bacillus sp. REN16 TaxID=2887296 RepID=UPI001E5D5E91|nr:hypothetical protein [Bacillus sp. REN16]MCC3356752.1 hypothetical protein [Bacillus sp. REN16]